MDTHSHDLLASRTSLTRQSSQKYMIVEFSQISHFASLLLTGCPDRYVASTENPFRRSRVELRVPSSRATSELRIG